MDIPDEAWDAAGEVTIGFGPSHDRLPEFVAGAVEAAAPHIARAAQVAVLREMAVRYREAAELPQSAYGADRLLWMAVQLEIEANGLEAGAGQEEVRDG